ncbi:MAG: NUDIX domain-containing protein [Candidatus Micrarchaeales archaeon]|jgi:8-oxo-dGTP pyrophosphatase MutT (NUDIX family)
MVKKCIVGTCFILDRKKTLLLEHKNINKWLPPGGHVEENETPMEAAIREALEETGLRVKILDSAGGKRIKYKNAEEPPRPMAILLEKVPYKTGPHIHFDLVYLAKPISRKTSRVKKGESNRFRWVGKEEIEGIDTYEDVKDLMKRIL